MTESKLRNVLASAKAAIVPMRIPGPYARYSNSAAQSVHTQIDNTRRMLMNRDSQSYGDSDAYERIAQAIRSKVKQAKQEHSERRNPGVTMLIGHIQPKAGSRDTHKPIAVHESASGVLTVAGEKYSGLGDLRNHLQASWHFVSSGRNPAQGGGKKA